MKFSLVFALFALAGIAALCQGAEQTQEAPSTDVDAQADSKLASDVAQKRGYSSSSSGGIGYKKAKKAYKKVKKAYKKGKKYAPSSSSSSSYYPKKKKHSSSSSSSGYGK